MVFNSQDMSCPLEVVLQWHGFSAGDLGLLQNFDVCYEVSSMNVEDGAHTVLVKALEETHVTTVGDPNF